VIATRSEPAEVRPSRPRDLAEEQRAALPPRLRARLGNEPDEDLEDFLPRSRGRGVLIISLAGVALVMTAIMLVRFGVITGLPFMPAPQQPTRAAERPAPAPEPVAATFDSTARAAAADSAAKALVTGLPTAAAPTAASSPAEPKSAAASGPAATKPATESTPEATKPAASSAPAATKPAAASSPAAAKPAAASVPAATKPAAAGAPAATKPAAASAPAATKPAATATFGISVATYLDSDRAKTERDKLAASTSMPVTVQETTEGGTSVYHLVLGGFDSRASAESAASDLIQRGLIEEARIVAGPKVAKR
jgi:hypothetical protein